MIGHSMKLIPCFSVASLIAVCNVFGQVPGSEPPVSQEFRENVLGGDVSSTKTVTDMINECVENRNWREGRNEKSNGSVFFVATGIGTIPVGPTHPAYLSARSRAFSKAMLQAKTELTKFLSSEIERNTESSVVAPNLNVEDEGAVSKNASEMDSLLGKSKKLIELKLDNLLKGEGFSEEISPEKKKVEVKKILSTTKFKDFIGLVARGKITGMQAFQTHEGLGAGKNPQNQIGVVCVWSKKLQDMAESVITGKALPRGVPKKSLSMQIPRDPKGLMMTFGVQQKKDEQGNYVLLAFGQSSSRSEKTIHITIAQKQARLAAIGMLRSFFGEVTDVKELNDSAETVDDLEGGMTNYKDESSYEEHIKTVAQKMKISGISTLKSWTAIHPLADKTLAGVVVAWSPQSASMAKKLSTQMSSTPSSTSSSSTSVHSNGSGSGMVGSGVEADEDF